VEIANMAAEDTIENHYVEGFRQNLELSPQDMGSRLFGTVDAELSYGEPGTSFNCDDIGESNPQPVTTRVPDSPEGFVDQIRRGGHFEAFNDGKFIDDLDKARQMSDPANKVMAAMMAGKGRYMDDKIVDIALGVAYSGRHLTTSNAFNTTDYLIGVQSRANLHAAEASVVAASGDLGLTWGKLISAHEKLELSDIDGPAYFWWGARQKSQLLASVPGTSSDYAAVKALVNGETDTLLDMKFVSFQRLPLTGTVRRCVALKKKAVQYKARSIQNAWIDRRKDKAGRWYAYYEQEHAGARRYDEGVIAVDCSEA
jgi:hypothetical protein